MHGFSPLEEKNGKKCVEGLTYGFGSVYLEISLKPSKAAAK
jgi:hypothetical protein